jgi:PIF1-like helicase
MKESDKRKYIGLVASSASSCDEPFHLSVAGSIEENEVREAILDVAQFLPDHHLFKNSVQLKAVLGFRERSDDTKAINLPGGLLVYFLSVLLLMKRKKSIQVAMETYNGKIRGRNYPFCENVVNEMRRGEEFKTTFLIKRFVELIAALNQNGDLNLTNDNFKYGIGAVVDAIEVEASSSKPLFVTINPIKISSRFREIAADEVFLPMDDLKVIYNQTSKMNTKFGSCTSISTEKMIEKGIQKDDSVQRQAWANDELKAIATILLQINKRKTTRSITSVDEHLSLYQDSTGRFPWSECEDIIKKNPNSYSMIKEMHLSKPLSNCRISLETFLRKEFSQRNNQTSSSALTEHVTLSKESIRVENFLVTKASAAQHLYYSLGFLMPSNCLSVTYLMKDLRAQMKLCPFAFDCPEYIANNESLHRVQSYSFTLRDAAKGQSNVSLQNFCVQNNDRTYLEFDKAFNTLLETHNKQLGILTKIANEGGIGRIEVSHSCKANQINQAFDSAVESTRDIVSKNVRCYDAQVIATLGEILSFVCYALANSSVEVIKYSIGNIDELFDVWRNITSIMNHFYDGRIFLNDNSLYMRRLASFFGRPILNKNWKDTWNMLRLLCLTSMPKVDEQLQSFRTALGLHNTDDISDEMGKISKNADSKEGIFQLILSKRSSKNKSGIPVFCCHCYKISRTRLTDHNCDNKNESFNKPAYVGVDTDLFLKYLKGRFQNLNDSQQSLVLEVISTRRNIFITGGPGVGKSYVMTLLRDYMYMFSLDYDTIAVTGSSNIAASLIYGKTIHKFLNIEDADSVEEKMNLRGDQLITFVNDHIKNMDQHDPDHMVNVTYAMLKVLFIDEVQQVNADLWSYLDCFLRIARNRMNEPFGGLWVIACGDVLQLPPIFKMELCKSRESSYYSFFFEDRCFSEGSFYVGYLKEIMRQSDSRYINIISSVRLGNFDEEILASINDPTYFGTEIPLQAMEVCAQAGSKYNPSTGRQYYLTASRFKVNLWKQSERSETFEATRLENAEMQLSTFSKTFFLVTEHAQKIDILEAKYQILGMKAKLIKIVAQDTFSSTSPLKRDAFLDSRKQAMLREVSAKMEETIYVQEGMLVQLTQNVRDHPKRSLAIVSKLTFKNDDLIKVTLTTRRSLGDLKDGISFIVERSIVTTEYKFKNGNILILKRRQFPFTDASVMLIHNCIGMTIDVPCIYDNSRVKAGSNNNSSASFDLNVQYGFLCTAISRCVRPSLFYPLHPISIEEFTTVHPVAKRFDEFFASSTDLVTPCNGMPDINSAKTTSSFTEDDEIGHTLKRFKQS